MRIVQQWVKRHCLTKRSKINMIKETYRVINEEEEKSLILERMASKLTVEQLRNIEKIFIKTKNEKR